MQKFKARLEARGPGGAWIFINVPFSVEKVFKTKARVSVKGTINDFPYRTSILPQDGTHYLPVNKQMQAGAQAKAGDTVRVTMDLDQAPRVVELPPELEQLLRQDACAAAFFDGLSFTHRKEFADWIGSAKRPETKEARLKKTAEMLAKGEKLAR
jgi:hypothetical protein